MENKKIWSDNIDTEVGYWRKVISDKSFINRFDYELTGQCSRFDIIHYGLFNGLLNVLFNETETINLLDVGAGPISVFLGSGYDKKVNVTSIDPLADIYNELISQHYPNISHSSPTIYGDGENICEQFPNKFDIICSRNAIDHTYDPISVMRNMIKMSKKFTYITIDMNEGKNQNYDGLHQWDFCPTENGDLLLSNKDKSINCSIKEKLGIDELIIFMDYRIFREEIIFTQMHIIIPNNKNIIDKNALNETLLKYNNIIKINNYETVRKIKNTYVESLYNSARLENLQIELDNRQIQINTYIEKLQLDSDRLENLQIELDNRQIQINAYIDKIQLDSDRLNNLQNELNYKQNELNYKQNELNYKQNELNYKQIQINTYKKYKLHKILKLVDLYLPKNSIRRDIIKIAYKIAKLCYKLVKKIYNEGNTNK